MDGAMRVRTVPFNRSEAAEMDWPTTMQAKQPAGIVPLRGYLWRRAVPDDPDKPAYRPLSTLSVPRR